MKTADLLTIAAGAVLTFVAWQAVKGRVAHAATAPGGITPAAQSQAGWATELFQNNGAAFSGGWRYFNDGTAIAPNGDYYFDGQKVYSAQS
jgi:hypothetical protein